MTSVSGISALSANTQVYAGIPAAVANAGTGSAAAATTTSTTASTTSSATSAITSKTYVDPLAGVITEYLNGNGSIQSEIPSATVVAYLKAGLTAQGYPKAPQTVNVA